MTLLEKTDIISSELNKSKQVILEKCMERVFVRYNNTDTFLEKHKEKIGKAVHLEWHVGNNSNHKKSEKCVTCCLHVEELCSQINWEQIIYSDLFKKFEELVLRDTKLFDKDLILVKETPNTFDCRNLQNHGKNIRSYWIGFEFSKIEDFNNRVTDIVLYSHAFGKIIDKHIWLIEDLILTTHVR
ncbi:MAG: hypothetical protein EBY39_10960 [Flavobacteriia bacterium]|nr:hypothetical protein [Flavobacteriia bacterium]